MRSCSAFDTAVLYSCRFWLTMLFLSSRVTISDSRENFTSSRSESSSFAFVCRSFSSRKVLA